MCLDITDRPGFVTDRSGKALLETFSHYIIMHSRASPGRAKDYVQYIKTVCLGNTLFLLLAAQEAENVRREGPHCYTTVFISLLKAL